MFGYVVVNKDRLSEQDYDLYHSVYCGLCRELSEHYGKTMSMTLNNDMTFLAALLSGLEEPDTSVERKRCPVHLTRMVDVRRNKYTYSAAEMTVLLSYYKCLDDLKDEGKKPALFRKLEKAMAEVRAKYPEKVKITEEALGRISKLEEENCEDLDLLCNTFGEVLGTVFTAGDALWDKALYNVGYSLGKFIYLMDAYDDLEEDLKKGLFNPLKSRKDSEHFDQEIESILELFMSMAADAFERMPVIEYSEVIRNILYSGVWSRFEEIRQKKEKKVKNV